MTVLRKCIAMAAVGVTLASCGGGSDGGNRDDESVLLSGVFIDSAVEGVTFATATQSGVTSASGEFSYISGESIIFSIGDAAFPVVQAAAQVTPIDMAASGEVPAAMTTNIARLLQTLDEDGNPNNGIKISSLAAVSAGAINFNVGVDQFEQDPAVINLISNSGSVSTSLVSADEANTHLNETLGNTESSGVVETLITGSPWYSIRLGADFTECANKYTFEQDGTVTVVGLNQDNSGFTTTAADYQYANSNLTITRPTDGRSFEYTGITITGGQWTAGRDSANDLGPYTESAFSLRTEALSQAAGRGLDCSASLAQ